MKNSGSKRLTILVVFIAGVLLIAWHSRIDILQWVVILVGITLIVPALYSFIIALGRKRRGEGKETGRTARTSTLWAAVAAIALGVWMVVDPSFFAGLLAYIFGAILVLYGIYHIVMMSHFAQAARISILVLCHSGADDRSRNSDFGKLCKRDEQRGGAHHRHSARGIGRQLCA